VFEITDFLLLEVTLMEKTTLDLLEKVKKFYPYFETINPIKYGADIIFSKKPIVW
jgi:hypothetical protein